MASSTIRKALGAVKDQTSIGLAKVAGNVAPDLEVLVVKATSHDNEPADEKYVREILNMISYSRGYVSACVFAISKRLGKTRDWIVALKALVLVHKLLNDGDPAFGQEMMVASRKGSRILNMSDFRDETHSNSWDQSGFVRALALYLDQKLEFMVYERKSSGVDDERKKRYDDEYVESRYDRGYGVEKTSRSYGDLNESRRERNEMMSLRELGADGVLERLNQLLQLLHRFLASKPAGAAKNTRMVLVALYSLVKESFSLYADISDVLKYLQDTFVELEYAHSVKAFDAYVGAAKMIDELIRFYSWCKDTGVVRSSEFLEVHSISDELLGTLEGQLREKRNRSKSRNETREEITLYETKEEDETQNMNEIKALPPPEDFKPPITPQPLQKLHHQKTNEEDLVNLKDDGVSADQQGNNMALALFSVTKNDHWVEFSTDEDPKATSAWQNPAAETGKADWELVLVESSSNLSKQKADLGGGFNPLLLNGMYDQGTVRQHVDSFKLSGGSASSIVLPGAGNAARRLLALPAPEGSVRPVGAEDPFEASLSVPPPSYVQIADMEKKQHLLVQEQKLWQQYTSDGMQGQMGLAKIGGYGMPQFTSVGQTGGYYYTSY